MEPNCAEIDPEIEAIYRTSEDEATMDQIREIMTCLFVDPGKTAEECWNVLIESGSADMLRKLNLFDKSHFENRLYPRFQIYANAFPEEYHKFADIAYDHFSYGYEFNPIKYEMENYDINGQPIDKQRHEAGSTIIDVLPKQIQKVVENIEKPAQLTNKQIESVKKVPVTKANFNRKKSLIENTAAEAKKNESPINNKIEAVVLKKKVENYKAKIEATHTLAKQPSDESYSNPDGEKIPRLPENYTQEDIKMFSKQIVTEINGKKTITIIKDFVLLDKILKNSGCYLPDVITTKTLFGLLNLADTDNEVLEILKRTDEISKQKLRNVIDTEVHAFSKRVRSIITQTIPAYTASNEVVAAKFHEIAAISPECAQLAKALANVSAADAKVLIDKLWSPEILWYCQSGRGNMSINDNILLLPKSEKFNDPTLVYSQDILGGASAAATNKEVFAMIGGKVSDNDERLLFGKDYMPIPISSASGAAQMLAANHVKNYAEKYHKDKIIKLDQKARTLIENKATPPVININAMLSSTSSSLKGVAYAAKFNANPPQRAYLDKFMNGWDITIPAKETNTMPIDGSFAGGTVGKSLETMWQNAYNRSPAFKEKIDKFEAEMPAEVKSNDKFIRAIVAKEYLSTWEPLDLNMHVLNDKDNDTAYEMMRQTVFDKFKKIASQEVGQYQKMNFHYSMFPGALLSNRLNVFIAARSVLSDLQAAKRLNYHISDELFPRFQMENPSIINVRLEHEYRIQSINSHELHLGELMRHINNKTNKYGNVPDYSIKNGATFEPTSCDVYIHAPMYIETLKIKNNEKTVGLDYPSAARNNESNIAAMRKINSKPNIAPKIIIMMLFPMSKSELDQFVSLTTNYVIINNGISPPPGTFVPGVWVTMRKKGSFTIDEDEADYMLHDHESKMNYIKTSLLWRITRMANMMAYVTNNQVYDYVRLQGLQMKHYCDFIDSATESDESKVKDFLQMIIGIDFDSVNWDETRNLNLDGKKVREKMEPTQGFDPTVGFNEIVEMKALAGEGGSDYKPKTKRNTASFIRKDKINLEKP